MNIENVTTELLHSYAKACRDLHDFVEYYRLEGYNLLVVPSRGASPFVDGAYMHAHQYRDDHYDNFDGAPRLRPINRLYLPFTADVGNESPIDSKSIRSFWSQVLGAWIRGEYENTALCFYKFLISKAGELAIDQNIRLTEKDGQLVSVDTIAGSKFIFVDTVVSGKAICDIFDGFAKHSIQDCHFILLIDQAGKNLKPQFAERICQMEVEGRATTIYVEQIFTEDEGPAMSGIWSLTLPELMASIQSLIPELTDVGAGLYYHEVSRRKDGSNALLSISNAQLGTLLYVAIREGAAAMEENSSTSRFLRRFQDHIKNSKLQDQEFTLQVAMPLITRNLPKICSVDVSGSHVLRARMAPADAMVREFLKQPTKYSEI